MRWEKRAQASAVIFFSFCAVCVCMHACAHVHAHRRARACVIIYSSIYMRASVSSVACIYTWRTKDNSGIAPQVLSTHFCDTGSPTCLDLTN